MKRLVGYKAAATVLLSFAIGVGQGSAQSATDNSSAGDISQGKWSKGLRVGLNRTVPNNNANTLFDLNPSTRYLLGGFVARRLSSVTTALVEVSYVDQGYGIEQALPMRVRLSYLEFPLLLKLSPRGSGSVKPYLLFGPNLRFLLRAHLDRTMLSEAGELISNTVDVKEKLESTDYGIVAALGVGMNMSGGMLILDVRFSRGLTDISKTVAGGFNNNWRNIFISSSIGYLF